jgi:hypothetical protein
MTSAIDIKRYKTRVIWREQLLTSGHFESSFILLTQFPRPARKNGHPGFEFAILEQSFCDNYIEPP